ncbi:hypothetical protein ACSQ67_021122 [Phaseolus vulgaris]
MPMEEWSGKEKVAQKVGNRSYTNEERLESRGDTLVKPIMLEAHVGSEGAHFLGERRSIERPKPADARDMEKPVERPPNAATGLVYHRRGKKGD